MSGDLRTHLHGRGFTHAQVMRMRLGDVLNLIELDLVLEEADQ